MVQGKNTLRIGQRALNELLDRIDSAEAASGGTDPKRTYRRFPFRRESVVIEIMHPGGSTVKLAMAGRNLSGSGVSLMHSSYVHEGSRCVVSLPYPGNRWVPVVGTVRRCIHREGRAHELGIQFDEEIPARDLLELDSMSESYTLEHPDPESLEGKVLVVDEDEMEHELIGKLLSETRLRLICVKSIEDAIKEAEVCDLIVSNYHLGETTAAILAARLWDASIGTPLAVMSSDKSMQLRDTMREAGAVGFISKPMRRDRLLCALAEFMGGPGSSAVIYTELPDDDPAAPLVERFIDGLPEACKTLRIAIKDDDLDSCLETVRRIAAQGPTLGFPKLGQVSEAAMQKLQQTHSASGAASELRSMLLACQRARMKPAA